MEIVKYTRDSRIQRIKAWYIDENSLELSEGDLEFKNTLRQIWGLRANKNKTRLQAVDIIAKEKKISQATAYRYYKNALFIFGDVDEADSAAERMIYKERYDILYQKAMKKGNLDLAKKINDSLVKMLPNIDENKVDPKKLEASLYKMNLPRSANKLLTAMLDSGVVDFNSLGAEDVDFQEVKEENAEEIEEEHE